MGRKAIGDRPMTSTERGRRHRQRLQPHLSRLKSLWERADESARLAFRDYIDSHEGLKCQK